ncbi:hypothetical protein [Chryseobacterium sp. 2R14A]|uniref:hypothetical protein n=1 Tax=Chryseobacterium sp. 2R14A TaxID=3380353 RepID=UPI003CE87487
MEFNIDKIKNSISETYLKEQINNSKKISSSEIFNWETKYQIDFPINFKQYLQEIGLFQFDYSFYECLNSDDFYFAFLTDDFINILKSEGIPEDEIENAKNNYNFKNQSFDSTVSEEWTGSIDKIYNSLGKDEFCIEIGVCLFNDTYNCYHYLMLTGRNQNRVVNSFGKDTYENVDYFWTYLLK